jgi:hypothetical protein
MDELASNHKSFIWLVLVLGNLDSIIDTVLVLLEEMILDASVTLEANNAVYGF